MKTRIILALGALALSACKGASLGPKGWQPIPGASAAWTLGTGEAQQQYSLTRQPYSGMLHDLASSVTIDVLLRHSGARLHGSLPLAACPGAAGIATFSLRGGKLLQEGFAVHDGQATRAAYIRPEEAPSDPAVAGAMQNALC